MGLYDGHGRLVKPLSALRSIFKGKTRLRVNGSAFLRAPAGRHWLALKKEGKYYLFKPEDDEK